jgi:hypothetical protein
MASTSLFDDLSQSNEGATDGKTPPTAKTVDWFHGNASTSQPTDIHHRIGFAAEDAAAGNHNHDGHNSTPLFDGTVTIPAVSGASTMTQLADAINIIAGLLREKGAG